MKAPGVSCLVAAALSVPAHAQDQQPATSSQSGRATASVVHPLRASATEGLSFGAFVIAPGQSGQITVSDAEGETVYSGSLRPVCQGRNACVPHPAAFAVTGQSDRTYGINLPLQLTITGEFTGSQMRIEALSATSQNDRSQPMSGRLGRNGQDRFSVGGNLRIPENTRPDRYGGEFTVTVFYY